MTISGLSAGTYSVTVTDSHSCAITGSWAITQPPWWSIGILGCSTPCCGTGNSYAYSATIGGTYTNPVSYEWTVVGGIITNGANTSQITVTWNCCGQGTVSLRVTESSLNNCVLVTTKTVTVYTQPDPIITGPASVFANQSGTTYCTPNFTGHTYLWTVVGGIINGGQGSSCITVNWGSYPACACGSVTVCETNNVTGCIGCTTMNITILPGNQQNLDGYVYYKNGYNTGLNGVAVKLYNISSGIIVTTDTTGPNFNSTGQPGYFAFTNVPTGTYQLQASFNGTWGGNNATDALLVQLYVVNPVTYPLTGLNLLVADVNGSGPPNPVTGLDALYIKLRTVGAINSYPAGDWKFDNPTVPVSPVLFSQNIMGLCVGDVNGSYIPTGMKDASLLSVQSDGVQTIPVNENFIYNIKSNQVADLGAMTLFMNFDPTRFEIVSVNTSLDGMKYVIEDGRIALAWSDTKPFPVKTDETVLSLTMKAKVLVSQSTQIFSLIPGSEFADPKAKVFENFVLKMADVLTPNGTKEFSMFNYPNPFSNTTNIVYTLPESGKVHLVLTNMYGQTIRVLVDEVQTAGSHIVLVNNVDYNLNQGMYLYKIEVDGATTTYVKVNKMLFNQ
jgi:hypothetical protein